MFTAISFPSPKKSKLTVTESRGEGLQYYLCTHLSISESELPFSCKGNKHGNMSWMKSKKYNRFAR